MAEKKTRWWDGDSRERFWLETTDRPDLGVDLKAPQFDDSNKEHPAYFLIKEVPDGAIVLHYHKPRRAIVGWSVVTGELWAEEIVWGSHGTVAREAGVTPYRRPGWRLGLQGPFVLSETITLSQLRDAEPAIRGVHSALELRRQGRLYFPFELSASRPLRPTQFYLTKFPADLLQIFESLTEIDGAGPELQRQQSKYQGNGALGLPFETVDESAATSRRDPFSIDPSIVDRGTQGHARTLNVLAAYCKAEGAEPLRPAQYDPQFDLAWRLRGRLFVAEVKSTTVKNVERQMRLGLGQVLRYQSLLGRFYPDPVAVLAVERPIFGDGWVELCTELGVRLVWPGHFAELSTP